MKEERTALIEYRLEQADESLDSAQLLWDHKKYRPSVSRSYYAMFYAVQALLIRKQIKYQFPINEYPETINGFIVKVCKDEKLSSWN